MSIINEFHAFEARHFGVAFASEFASFGHLVTDDTQQVACCQQADDLLFEEANDD